jgi:hypothetical protein
MVRIFSAVSWSDILFNYQVLMQYIELLARAQ